MDCTAARTSASCSREASAPMVTPSARGITEHDALADAVPDGGDDVGDELLRDDRAADRGAFLAGLGGHLGDERT